MVLFQCKINLLIVVSISSCLRGLVAAGRQPPAGGGLRSFPPSGGLPSSRLAAVDRDPREAEGRDKGGGAGGR